MSDAAPPFAFADGKAPDALRTIGEVSAGLNIRQHQCGLCGVEDRFAELELESGPAAIGRVQVDTDREVVFRAGANELGAMDLRFDGLTLSAFENTRLINSD